ncbi:hypothetical protein Amet_2243 [Alkaliphilus metalliredigens QYMF]|uniref:Phosphatidate cytidylyltransferase n=1 Tax=Alkaliphilus metalliredigens (strain QYMF) TaxID=293826 RepID=A6TQD3_ALKMQ|nr:hypothetical protein [Alkaliphilus metalliredigens]ABR48401.1 hypothetical protein Amet_2243 [Alkaliphilus metalliredigens QYMF]
MYKLSKSTINKYRTASLVVFAILTIMGYRKIIIFPVAMATILTLIEWYKYEKERFFVNLTKGVIITIIMTGIIIGLMKYSNWLIDKQL